jgi:luciferase family oxidoreductase group 1
VMLSHYSSLKVAESFRVLETLFPGRIDLGIGRAPGSDGRTSQALAHGPGALGIEHFPNQIADLVAYLHDDLGSEHPFAGVRAMPVGPSAPEVWLLGSSAESASYAAHFGLAFSFAQFITGRGGAGVARAYREHFRPSAYLAEPRSSLGVFVICAETEAEARRLAKSRELFIARLYTGRAAPYPTVAEAEEYRFNPYELAIVDDARHRTIVGEPRQVRARLLEMGAEYEVDEFVVVTITEDFASRLRSYELLAEAFELPGVSTPDGAESAEIGS